MVLYTLFEHAAGYSVFQINASEEVGALLPEVQEAVTDLERFGRIVKLIAFSPFKNAANALENINSISEGVVHEDLKTFLESNVPVGKKKTKVQLGISDPKIGAAIQESCNIQCESGAAILEITRGIRFHFHKLIQGLTATTSGKAQLGLGHSYSRAKVKFNVHRVDNMIIQTIALVDQLDKDINTFAMRIREWYSYHFPELIKIVSDNHMYAKVAHYIKSRKDFSDAKVEGLEEILMDAGKAKAIYEASKSSMGMDISPIDLVNIESFATRVIGLIDYRHKLHAYLQSKMHQVAPNLQALIGDLVGARLIAHAGSLTNLAKYPASTVQILGAEKALFRALKTKGKTPKYGLIFHSSFIGKAAAKNKGRISRYLANKCSIASRIDCFSDTPTDLFGKKLHEQVEDRLKFYETGEAPMKNADAMKEVLDEYDALVRSERKSEKKKKKKKKEKEENEDVAAAVDLDESLKRKAEEVEETEDSVEKPRKKKRKSKSEETPDDAEETEVNGDCLQESEAVSEEPDQVVEEIDVDLEKQKKKKKKRKSGETPDDAEETEVNGDCLQESEVVSEEPDQVVEEIDVDSEKQKKKKKKRKSEETPVFAEETEVNDESLQESEVVSEQPVQVVEEIDVDSEKQKKKKKKRKSEETPVDAEEMEVNDESLQESEVVSEEPVKVVEELDEGSEKKRKKKKKKNKSEEATDDTVVKVNGDSQDEAEKEHGKEKKNAVAEVEEMEVETIEITTTSSEEVTEVTAEEVEASSKKSKKKKHKKSEEEPEGIETMEIIEDVVVEEQSKKKKKKTKVKSDGAESGLEVVDSNDTRESTEISEELNTTVEELGTKKKKKKKKHIDVGE